MKLSVFDIIGIAWRRKDEVLSALPDALEGIEIGMTAIPPLQRAWDKLAGLRADLAALGVDLPKAKQIAEKTAERVSSGELTDEERAQYEREKWWAA